MPSRRRQSGLGGKTDRSEEVGFGVARVPSRDLCFRLCCLAFFCFLLPVSLPYFFFFFYLFSPSAPDPRWKCAA